MNTIERARAWLASVPGAVSGQNGHSQTFTAATGLIHGFELSQSDALTLLQEWNQKCSPKWSESELNHKIRQAISTPHSNPKGYLKKVREICDKHGILLIIDEVMSGFGRTGKWFGFQNHDVIPDMIAMAKGLTCGYLPFGCLMVSDRIAAKFDDQVLDIS